MLGIHPYELTEYTPAELDALLSYAQSKRDAIKNAGRR